MVPPSASPHSVQECPEPIARTGEGMPQSVLSLIGKPFFQAGPGADHKFEGMGTGLALSRRLADSIGADLWFESAPGAGTRATVRFPRECAWKSAETSTAGA